MQEFIGNQRKIILNFLFNILVNVLATFQTGDSLCDWATLSFVCLHACGCLCACLCALYAWRARRVANTNTKSTQRRMQIQKIICCAKLVSINKQFELNSTYFI